MVESTNEFMSIINSVTTAPIMASLDVESLFTNIPIQETIEIILKNVYENPDISPPMIPRNVMCKLLTICTTKNPFKSPTGETFMQVDGVSMGSPLGPLFANFYMANLENNILNDLDTKPLIYCRYVDDIFVVIDNIE
jgi:hypothetical protein